MNSAQTKEITSYICFILILDNNGKPVYTKYYNGIEDIKQQRELEMKICQATSNLNVAHDEIDIFSINNYNIISKIYSDIAIFIGINEEDNECLMYNFLSIFENVLSNVLGNKITKEKIIDNYEQIVIIIDEMINEGIVMNTDGDSLEKILYLRGQAVTSGSGFMSFADNSSYGTSSTSSSSIGGGLFGSLWSGAKAVFGS